MRQYAVAVKVFPTRLMYFDGIAAEIDRRTVSGGISLSGEEDLVATDGGGRVVMDLTDAYLDDPAIGTAWRALDTLLDGGATPIIVPLGDARHQHMGDVTTPIGGLPWWDESDFTGTPLASLTTAAALRATQLAINVASLPAPVRPGIWFSINHVTMRHRAYRIAEIVSDNGTTAVIKMRPPLREAAAIGTGVEFVDPKCTMRAEGGLLSPTSLGFASGSARFIEWPGAPQ